MTVIPQIAASDSSTKSRNLLASTLVSGHALKHLYMSAFSVILPEMKAGLALSNTATGAIITARDISSGIMTLPAGFLADRFGTRWPIILTAAMLFLAIGYFLSGTLDSYWLILGAVMLAGLGVSIWHPAAIASISRLFPQKLGLAVSLHGAGGNTGEVLGPIIAGGILLTLAWNDLLQVSLLPLAFSTVVIWLVLRGMRGQQGISSLSEYLSAVSVLVKNRVVMAVVLISGAKSMSHQAILIFIPIYLREDLGYSTFVVGVYVSLLQAAGIAAHPIMGSLSDRIGRKKVLTPSMIAFGLLCIALAFAAPGWQLTLTILTIGIFVFTFHALFVATAMEIASVEVHGTAIALVYASSHALGAIGPAVGGVLADGYGIGATFIFSGAIALTAAVFFSGVKLNKAKAELSGDVE